MHVTCTALFQKESWPGGKSALITVFLADIIFTVMRESIKLANTNQQEKADYTVILYALTYGLLILVILVTSFMRFKNDKHDVKNNPTSHMIFHYHLNSDFYPDHIECYCLTPLHIYTTILQLLVATLFFYGDNYLFVVSEYKAELSCDEGCQANHRTAAIVCLGSSLLISQMIIPFEDICRGGHLKHDPGYFRNYDIVAKTLHENDKQSYSDLLNLVIILVKVDTIFTAVLFYSYTPDICRDVSNTDVAIHSNLFVIGCVVVSVSLILYSLQPSHSKNSIHTMSCTFKLSIAIVCFVMCATFPIYILSDNGLILSCASVCEGFAKLIGTCGNENNDSVRLTFSFVTLVAVSCVLLIIHCNYRDRVKALNDSYTSTLERLKGLFTS